MVIVAAGKALKSKLMIMQLFGLKQNSPSIELTLKRLTASSLSWGGTDLPVMPAPYLVILIPDSTLPSKTTNFVLKVLFSHLQ
jgi:hypothetical protein